MNTKSLLASVIVLAFTLLQSPAQQPQAPIPSPVQQAQTPIPEQITVNMLGEVANPARITLPKGATLLDAFASVGGFSKIANPHHVILIHRGTGPKPDTVKIDMNSIAMGLAKDISLRDGDTVVVGQATF